MSRENKTSLIIHGHFYQPPREKPDTGLIPFQKEAYPYDNWNEKIYRECYKANSASPYLSQNRKIINIKNNYEYISFNFGPTLLTWLHEFHEETESLIIEADKKSLLRLGHGNAICQCYNHTILPLDNEKDQRIQIEWGKRDFEKRFNREAEGIWLSEAAINTSLVDILAEEGFKFVILSPHQVRAIEKNGKMTNVEAKDVPYWQSYILTGKKGKEISAFFYNPALAEAISFQHILRNADTLYQSLLDIKRKDFPPLINTATDGEIYGHHEPHGDMALSALIEKVKAREDFEFDNYASYLEKHPSSLHAELFKGEDEKGTSWSCSHGVSRWYKDCGCSTGGKSGWNQKWRGPLRRALEIIAAKFDILYKSEIEKIFSLDITEELTKEVVDVFSSFITMDSFLQRLHKKYEFDKSYDSTLTSLLVALRDRYYSFTSCAFFFSDISGIETVQSIKYVIDAIRNIQRYSPDDLTLLFLSSLKDAHSNIDKTLDGINLAEREAKKISGSAEAASFFFLNRIFAPSDMHLDKYGYFTLSSIDEKDGHFHAVVYDNLKCVSFSFSALSLSCDKDGLRFFLSISSREKKNEGVRVTQKNLPLCIAKELSLWMDYKLVKSLEGSMESIISWLDNLSIILSFFADSVSESFKKENGSVALKVLKYLLENDGETDEIGKVVSFISKTVPSDNSLPLLFSSYFEKHSGNLTEERAEKLLRLLLLCKEYSINAACISLQNTVYSLITDKKKTTIDKGLLSSLERVLNIDEGCRVSD